MSKIFTNKKTYSMFSNGPTQQQESPGGFDAKLGKIDRKPADANDSLASYMANSYITMNGGKGLRGNWSRIADSTKVHYPKMDGSKIDILNLQGRTNAKQARAKYNISARKPGEKR